MKEGWRIAAKRAGLDVEIGGIDPLPHLGFPHPEAQHAATLFTQEMLDRGFLATRAFYATFAHQDLHVDEYLSAVEDVFRIIADALDRHNFDARLRGPVAHAGFHRLT